jgi:hypothetical protein
MFPVIFVPFIRYVGFRERCAYGSSWEGTRRGPGAGLLAKACRLDEILLSGYASRSNTRSKICIEESAWHWRLSTMKYRKSTCKGCKRCEVLWGEPAIPAGGSK